MWPIGLTLSSEIDDHVDVSDIFDLTPKAAAVLASLPNSARAIVSEELSGLFRQVMEVAYYCQIGASHRLNNSDLTQQIQALVSCDEGFVIVRFSVGWFWVTKSWYDPRILITDIALSH